MRNLLTGLAAMLCFLSAPLSAQSTPDQDASQNSSSPPMQMEPAFKGSWDGPTEVRLPGPGPEPGQSMADYFANLESGDRSPVPKHVLVLGGSRGFHHDSIPATMNFVFEAGEETGLWLTEFATDYRLVNSGGGQPMRTGFQPVGLGDFDAVVIANASGNWELDQDQRDALISFVREGGGFVVIHAGLNANGDWQDYVDMTGGEMTGHPFNDVDSVVYPFPLVNESPDFPAVSHFPDGFVHQDELYVIRNWSREDVNVLLRMNTDRLDTSDLMPMLPPDLDIPVAWTKSYGDGRVFASSIGHHAEAFDDPQVRRMYSEAIKWSLGLTEGDDAPHPLRNPRHDAGN